MKWILLLLSITFLSCHQNQPTDEWTLLFNEKDLSNWEIKNGTAEYHIEGKELVGTSKLNIPNTFLCTKKRYEDFILELELKVDAPLNSGIQIRSNSLADYHDGVVHGYQVEVDPSPRAFSGGIYDESRRGWLYPLCENSAGRAAFKNGTWNHYRIEAIGTAMNVWVNGVPTARLRDNLTSKGFIGLQVHSIGQDSSLLGKTVRWRNIQIATEGLDKLKKEMDSNIYEINLVPHQISEWEKAQGYELLLGQTDTIPFDGKNENIITAGSAQYMELKFEFKIAPQSEGGVRYHLNDEEEAPLIFQIIDNELLNEVEQKGPQSLASLKDRQASENLCVPGRHRDFRGLDAWNTGRIIMTKDQIEHWMNGYKMVEVDAPDAWESAVGYLIVFYKNRGNVTFRNVKRRME